MVSPADFYEMLSAKGIDFFTGVPDSLLKNFCAYVEDHASVNIITANEGNAVGLAAGHYLATGKPALVYMQNSGIGNAVNPLISLMDEDVYKMPVFLLIGWRGEPGVKDEPQHVKQGKVTLSLLEAMGIDYAVLDEQSSPDRVWQQAKPVLVAEKPFALVVKKGVFGDYKLEKVKKDISELEKERAIEIVAAALGQDDLIVSTTGKISRELFEIRERRGESHAADFLTVGSMGHTSQIAMGIAASRPSKRVYCFDGDGSVLMHMGSLPVNASLARENFRHVVFNNAAHDSVGGQPTVAGELSLTEMAAASGYRGVKSVDNEADLQKALGELTSGDIQFLEVRVKKGSRKELGRPTITPQECKQNFMGLL